MKLSCQRQIFLFISIWFAWSQQGFGQQTTVNFNSYIENQGLSNPHVEGELRFEAIKGASATCTVCVGIDINEGKNGGPGLDDSNQEIGGIIGWKISRADDASFQFLSIWLQDRDISNTLGTSDSGTIKAFKGGAQVGGTKNINFDSGTSGLKSFATDPDFFDVDYVLIEGVDLFLILDEVTYNDIFVDGDNTPPTVLAVNLIGAPLSTATSVTYNVEFSKIAKNVTVDDFELTKTGSANGTIASVSGTNATYSVLVTGLSGEGTIRLDIKAGTDIANENNVSGTAAFTAGQLHNISPCLVEDFEDETDGSKTFSYGGNDFSIIGNLEVHTETASIGINGSRYVLLNTGSGPYVINSLSDDISLRKFAVYLSSDAAGNNPTNDGSITVVGKKDGSQVYSITKSSGFPTDFSANNGYYIFDLSTEGGTDNSKILIDQLEISLGSAFQYINIDNFEFCIDLDVIDPVIDNCPTDITVSNDAGECNAAVSWTAPTATDNSGSVDLISNFEPGAVFLVGTTEVTYTATDAAGNQVTCSFKVTVEDTEDPIISCPANVSEIVAFGVPGKVITYATPTFSDNCAGASIERTAGLASGSTFPVGETIVTYLATDAAGNTAGCSFTVTITEDADAVDPEINNCPSDITVSNDPGDCSAAVTWAAPAATDNSGSVDLVSNFEPGAVFLVGTTKVTYTATDAAGNQVTCSFDVTVADDELPVIGSVSDISVSVPAGQTVTSVSVPEPSVSDNCSATVTGVRNDGNLLTDPYPLGETTITWSAEDPSGNDAVEVTQKVTVTQSAPPLSITSFTLINSRTDVDMFTLTNGMQINQSQVQGLNLNIRANTNPSVVGSVYLTISGPVNRKATENDAPYALFGDKNGDYNGRSLPAGTYTLTARAYSMTKRRGTAGTESSITFSIVNNSLRMTDETDPAANEVMEKEKPTTEVLSEYTLKAFPNPVKDGRVSIVDSRFQEGLVKYVLYSINGAKLTEGQAEIGAGKTIRLDFSGSAKQAGMYILILDYDNYLAPQRVQLIFE